MDKKNSASWLALVGRFLVGQGLVQALTLVAGLLLVRVLPVEQYALYTVAGTLLVVISVGSNFGLSQAIVSLGSSRRDERLYLGSLLDASRWWSRRLMLLAMPCTVALAIPMLGGQPWSLSSKIACVVCVLLIGWHRSSPRWGGRY
jgi:O-antigen/teichoic acid export membrane protein